MRLLISSILLVGCQIQQPRSQEPAPAPSCPSGQTDTSCGCLPAGDVCCPDGGYCDGGTTCVQYGGDPGWSCADVFTVTISMTTTPNGASACPDGRYLTLSPDPATLRVGDLVKWKNTDTIAHTIWQKTAPAEPITSAQPGETSGDIWWGKAEVIQYYLAECSTRLGTVVVTLN